METTLPGLHPMSLQIREITLWRREIATQSTALAEAVQPLVAQGIELEVLLRYRHPTDKWRAFVEVCPRTSYASEDVATALEAAGFIPRNVAALLIESDNDANRSDSLAQMIASLDVNIMFLATQIIDGKSGATIGFETPADAQKAVDTFMQMAARSRNGAHQTEKSYRSA